MAIVGAASLAPITFARPLGTLALDYAKHFVRSFQVLLAFISLPAFRGCYRICAGEDVVPCGDEEGEEGKEDDGEELRGVGGSFIGRYLMKRVIKL
jgi:hypothetical protein